MCGGKGERDPRPHTCAMSRPLHTFHTCMSCSQRSAGAVLKSAAECCSASELSCVVMAGVTTGSHQRTAWSQSAEECGM